MQAARVTMELQPDATSAAKEKAYTKAFAIVLHVGCIGWLI